MRFSPVIVSCVLVASLTWVGGCDASQGRDAGSPGPTGGAPVTRPKPSSRAVDLLAAATRPADPPERIAAPATPAGKQYDAPPPMTIDPAGDYSAVLKTSMGEVAVKLFAKDAPGTVNNFVFLAREGFYDGTIFHRVIDDFMVQGGDPTGTGMGGPGYTIPDEVKNNPNRHTPFTLSMAKTSAPNTGGSQFFITEVATPHLDGIHTVFGHVTKGQDVVTKIESASVGAGSKPLTDVVLQSVTILKDGKPLPPNTPTTRPAE